MKILQVGYGAIGHELFPTYKLMAEKMNGELVIQDPPKGYNADLSQHYDVAFVAVPTPTIDGKCDASTVEDAVKAVAKSCDVVVIKSTVPVGETAKIIKEIAPNCIFSPEFTSTNQHKGSQNFVVLGGERTLCKKVARLYMAIHSADFEIVYTDPTTAEMVKYTLNYSLALKVTFCNEINKACKEMGIEYEDVRNIWTKDSRISPAHTFVYEDKPFYDSHCFNKDIPAFVAQFHLPLSEAVNNINIKAKEEYANDSKNNC